MNSEQSLLETPLPPEYRQTWFQVYDREYLSEQEGIILTAHNPLGQATEKTINRSLNEQLEACMAQQQIDFMPILAGSLDFSHQEPSYLLNSHDVQSGKSIARKFNQLALFEIKGDELWLHHCWREESERVDSWSARLVEVRTSA